MRKVLLSLALAGLLYGCNKPTTKLHWRNAQWNIKPDSTFVLLNKGKDSVNIYSRINEKLCIGTEYIDSVRYLFYKGNLYKVVVYLPKPIYDTMDNACLDINNLNQE